MHAGQCAVNDVLQVDGVRFVSVCCPDILTVKAIADDPRTGTHYPDPRRIRDALAPILRITPVDVSIPDYRATIDITEDLRKDIAEFPNGYTRADGSQSKIPCCFSDEVAVRLRQLKQDRFLQREAQQLQLLRIEVESLGQLAPERSRLGRQMPRRGRHVHSCFFQVGPAVGRGRWVIH